MGGNKNQYTTREQAVKQLCWHAKRAKGAKFTIVVCKTAPTIFHIISSREAKK